MEITRLSQNTLVTRMIGWNCTQKSCAKRSMVGIIFQKNGEFTFKVAPHRHLWPWGALAFGSPGLGEPWRDTLGVLGGHYSFRVSHNFVVFYI